MGDLLDRLIGDEMKNEAGLEIQSEPVEHVGGDLNVFIIAIGVSLQNETDPWVLIIPSAVMAFFPVKFDIGMQQGNQFILYLFHK
jgi:hypothetical protein